MGGGIRSLNFFEIGDQVTWTNGPTFKGKIIGKIAMSETLPKDLIERFKKRGYIIPNYSKLRSHHVHRLIVLGKNKRLYFVVVGKAEKVGK